MPKKCMMRKAPRIKIEAKCFRLFYEQGSLVYKIISNITKTPFRSRQKVIYFSAVLVKEINLYLQLYSWRLLFPKRQQFLLHYRHIIYFSHWFWFNSFCNVYFRKRDIVLVIHFWCFSTFTLYGCKDIPSKCCHV